MRLEILGCSGGVSINRETTSFLVDEDLLIDAGTGLHKITLDKCLQINSVILTHSHLDHISNLPFLLNNTIGKSSKPLHVYGLIETITALRQHIFNGSIWPDFTALPSTEKPSLVFHTFSVGDVLSLGDKLITVLPADHTVPTVGFHVEKNGNSFAFTGDSTKNKGFWTALNLLAPVQMIIADNQYLESEKAISKKAKHYYAKILKEDFELLSFDTKLYLTHLPATGKDMVLNEAKQVFAPQKINALSEGQVYNFPL